eukprot:2101487-Heterocapsa_arctica.AAC.1
MFIGMLKAEPNWAELTVKQRIGTITISDEQQNREIDAAETRCDQIDGRRSEGGDNGRTTPGFTRYGVAKNE